ncbi:MAG: hypothetical protein JWO63_1348 [Frankiales bacterium]|jgi:hypothetical protein|nr:hypothetical protein [Frankiales bacterium]
MDDDARWAQAERLAQGDVDDAWRKRRRRKYVLIIVPAVAVGLLVGLLAVALGHHHRPSHRSEPPVWREAASLVLTLLGVGVEGASLWRMHGSGQLGRSWHSPLLALRFSQRRDVLKQIRGKRPLDHRHVAVVRQAALLMQAQTASRGMLLGLALLGSGQVVRQLSGASLTYLAYLVVLPLALWSISRNARAGAEFLRSHPEPSS